MSLSALDRYHLTIASGIDPATGRHTRAWKSSAAGQRIEDNKCKNVTPAEIMMFVALIGDGAGIGMIINGNTIPGSVLLGISFVGNIAAGVRWYIDRQRKNEYNPV